MDVLEILKNFHSFDVMKHIKPFEYLLEEIFQVPVVDTVISGIETRAVIKKK